MESSVKETISAIIARDSWSMADHGQLLAELRKASDAPRRLRQLLGELESANPQPKGAAALKIGVMRFMLSRPKDALAALAEATDNKDRRYFQAMCHKNLQQYDKAAEELEKAKSKGADDLAMDIQLVEVLALKGDVSAAGKTLGKINNRLGDSADARYLRGLIEDIGGFAQKAANSYEEARKADPNHTAATFRLAYICDLHGQEDQAIELYKLCLSQPPVSASALMNLAVLHEDAGRYEKAAKCLETVLANNPNHLRARLFLKDVQASMVMYYDEEQAKRVARRNAVLDIPVTDFELSVRARNCLKKMNIRTLGDLVSTTEPDLLAYKNFGETSLKEIKDMLQAKGLHLGQFADEPVPAPVAPAAKQSLVSVSPAGADEGIYNTPIENMQLSIRARRALQSLNIQTVADLVARTEPELLACKNFGQTSLNEVRQRLGEIGLSLKE